MGNDGGSIAKRRDLAKNKKKTRKIEKSALRLIRVSICSVSSEPLQPPIVACRLGNLFNKEALLEAMLRKSKKMRGFPYIRGLKDVKEVKLTPSKGGQVKFQCPVTGQEMDGYHKFLFNWSCGCVVSEKALTELPSPDCLMCSTPISEMVSLNQSEEEQQILMHSLTSSSLVAVPEAEPAPTKRAKIVDHEALDQSHLLKMNSDERKIHSEYKALFIGENPGEETFCCRQMRHGIR